MTKRVLVPIANGFEEIEALTVVDILRRAGAEVIIAGTTDENRIVGRSNISVIPDMSFDEAFEQRPYDMVILPGGLPNAHILRDDERIITLLKEQLKREAPIGAICAAPLALDRAGVLKDRTYTGHPTIKDQLGEPGYVADRVVSDRRVVTSRAAGTAMEFAFAIVRELFGEDKVNEVNTSVLARI